jgi:NAD(P)-dependent dehydrogenase (short-subunit alcohol dehydrogenase family)
MAHILITGASSGFGYEMAWRLATAGHRVFATMRGSNGRNAAARTALETLAAREGLGLEVLDLDVTDELSVNEAVGEAFGRAGHLDVVVNNAGIASIGLTEGFAPDAFAHVFDVNVNGAVRVNRAVLPSMRARCAGLLVHISSGAGRVTVPALAPYCASKYALEALADAYRYELHPWGIESVLVEPGIYRTPIFDEAVRPTDVQRLEGYGPKAGYVEQVRSAFAAAMGDPANPGASEVADAVARLIEMPAGARPFRTIVGASIQPLLGPLNDVADSLRPIVADIFGVRTLIAAEAFAMSDSGA